MDDKLPPFATIELYFGDDDVALTIMSRGKRFHICITVDDLREPTGNDELAKKYLNFRNKLDDDPLATEELEEWMIEACIPLIDHLAPSTNHKEPLSLSGYFNSEIIIIQLVNVEGHLKAIKCPDTPSITQSLTPNISVSEPTVVEAISQGVPCIPVSRVRAAMGPCAMVEDYDMIPETVQVIGEEDGTQYHFKPAFDGQSFQRELEILLRLRSSSFSNHLHVSNLGGLLIQDDGSSILGLLIDYVHGSKTLEMAVLEASKNECSKWVQQLREIVKQLHEEEIIWGDVKPDNVLIDPNNDAWVIDFGGGCVIGWIDLELAGTVDGDLQGLSKIESYLEKESAGGETNEA